MVSPSEGPTVDRGLLARLRADVGDETLRRYADAYLTLLSGRLDLVERAVAAGERAEALRVLTDVRVGASMLGAQRFAARAGTLEAAVRTGSQGEVEAGLAFIRESARLMASEMRREARRSDREQPDPRD
jgi:HPt (histidine-containing phosphotransfer) domain-containing protein